MSNENEQSNPEDGQIHQPLLHDPDDVQDVSSRPIKRGVDPTFKRNMMIIIAVVGLAVIAVIGIVVVLMGRLHPKTAGAQVAVQSNVMASTQDSTPMSPAMRAAVASEAAADFQRQRADGKSVIVPQDTINSVVPVAQAASAPVYGSTHTMMSSDDVVSQQLAQQRAQAYQQMQQQAQQSRQEGLQHQIEALMASAESGPAITKVKFEETKPGDSTSSPGGSFASAVAKPALGAASSSTASGPVVAEALALYIAEIANDLDTYRSMYCTANIVAGTLKDAFLKGQCTQKDEGLSIHFTEMRWHGQVYSIDAIGIDEATASDAMSNIDIDRRILQRYVFPITVATVNGAATELAKVASTTTTSSSSTTVSTAAATKGEAIAAGLSSGSNVLQNMANAAAAKPAQIKMSHGSPIGIMFNTPVRNAL